MHKVMTLALGLGKMALVLPLLVSAPASDADQLAAWLTGTFDTERQYAAADARLKVAPSVGGRWLDRQHARMIRVQAPSLGRTVIYLEWREGGPAGPISRQRIWVVDAQRRGGARMRFYTIRRPQELKGGDAAAFAALTPDDLVGYPTECEVRFVAPDTRSLAWVGRIDPAHCRIVAGSGRAMRLDVTIRLDGAGFSYREAGVLDNGVNAFAVPPGEPYRFVRLASD